MSHIVAIAVLFNNKFQPKGQVIFVEKGNKTSINVYAEGLKKGLHGFHIHSSGDLSEHCKILCSHYIFILIV